VRARIQMIRELNEEYGFTASILADLQGPKLRVGVMKDEVVVNPGDEIIFATGERFEGTKDRVYMTYERFPQDAKPGERILLDDGKLLFHVVSTDGKSEVKAKVIQGGPLKSKKGVNLPNTDISQPALTEKDIEDAIFAISLNVDWIALSFVRHAEDLMQLRDLIVKQMASILSNVENSDLIKVPQLPPHIRTNRYITKSICYHAANMANEINAKAISTLTNSGYTAFQISAWRPSCHILVFTSNKRILTRLSLLWGVRAFYYDKFVSTDETIEDVNAIACQKGYLDVGDMLISLASMPLKDKGMVNTLRVTEIETCNF